MTSSRPTNRPGPAMAAVRGQFPSASVMPVTTIPAARQAPSTPSISHHPRTTAPGRALPISRWSQIDFSTGRITRSITCSPTASTTTARPRKPGAASDGAISETIPQQRIGQARVHAQAVGVGTNQESASGESKSGTHACAVKSVPCSNPPSNLSRKADSAETPARLKRGMS